MWNAPGTAVLFMATYGTSITIPAAFSPLYFFTVHILIICCSTPCFADASMMWNAPGTAVLFMVTFATATSLNACHLLFIHAGASMMWNASGTAVLFMATCETDATNQSYYGESKLHYLPAEMSRADEACAVAMPKEGPVHDVQWSPAGDYFVVVAGFMPAKVRQRGTRSSGSSNSSSWCMM